VKKSWTTPPRLHELICLRSFLGIARPNPESPPPAKQGCRCRISKALPGSYTLPERGALNGTDENQNDQNQRQGLHCRCRERHAAQGRRDAAQSFRESNRGEGADGGANDRRVRPLQIYL